MVEGGSMYAQFDSRGEYQLQLSGSEDGAGALSVVVERGRLCDLRTMAARQLWLFLTSEDVESLLTTLDAREPGLIRSQGRYLRGDAADLLAAPSRLERRESLPSERRIYLLHRKHSADVVAHPQPAGPFAGWAQIDEERTDALVLRLPDATAEEIQPARLYAHTSYWRGGTKTRKRPVFAVWANQTLRWLAANLPRTSVDFIRIGQDALCRAQAGTLRLSYLYRPIAPVKGAGDPVVVPPQGAIGEDVPDEG
ncbi:MAG: hypothetical protein ACJ79H_05555 [Myxococcales bacterium]